MDPYQVLGISPNASDDEIKHAYRTLSKKYHPDANINSEHQAEYTEKFKQVQNAYKTIMDNRKKDLRIKHMVKVHSRLINIRVMIRLLFKMLRHLFKLVVIRMLFIFWNRFVIVHQYGFITVL